MTDPIKPKEVVHAKKDSMPNEVIEAFNELITENWKDNSQTATVKVKDLVPVIMSKLGLEEDSLIYKKNYLDVEGIFRKAGWKVKYEQPCGYADEHFDAYFEFSIPRKKPL